MLRKEVAAGRPMPARETFYFSLPVFATFALCIIFPYTHQAIKFPVSALAAFLGLCFLLLSGGRLYLHRYTLMLGLLFPACGLFWMTVGLIKGAPGALAVATVYVIWPIVFLLFINLLNSEAQLRRLAKIFLCVVAFNIVADFGYLLESLHVIPGSLFALMGSSNGFGLKAGSPAYSSTRVANFLFTMPMCMTIILHRWPRTQGGQLLLYSWIATIPSLVLIVLAQRRSVYVVTLASPFMGLAVDMLMAHESAPRRSRALVLMAAACAIIALMAAMWWAGYFDYLNWDRLFERFRQGFDFSGQVVSTDPDANARALQTTALIAGWRDSPLLGAGLGAAAGVLRSGDMPWAYELAYLAILFQTGTLGFTLYAFGVLWIVFGLVTVMRDRSSPFRVYAAVTLSGMGGFLIGSATDPYLLSFDYLWVLFMPVALVNLELMRRPARLREAVLC